MFTGRTRKLSTGAATVVAIIMVLASGAYACTVFRGKMTVTGGGGSTFATGNNSGMGWCIRPQDNTTVASGGGGKGADGSTITIRIEPASSTCGSHSPSTRSDYDLNFFNGKGFTYTISSTTGKRVYSTWQKDCMSPRLSGVVNLASNVSYTNGTIAQGDFKLPLSTNKNLSGEASAVCFSDPGGGNGNQVPIIITA
jgi:hypothetical protein